MPNGTGGVRGVAGGHGKRGVRTGGREENGRRGAGGWGRSFPVPASRFPLPVASVRIESVEYLLRPAGATLWASSTINKS